MKYALILLALIAAPAAAYDGGYRSTFDRQIDQIYRDSTDWQLNQIRQDTHYLRQQQQYREQNYRDQQRQEELTRPVGSGADRYDSYGYGF